MEWLERYFDRISKKHTRESAVLNMICFLLVGSIVIPLTVKFAKRHDSDYLYAGIFFATLSLLGVLMDALILRAVARRLKAESQNEP